ncbi:MAG TPA: 2-hydroxyacyl-CoA dehydratase family protein, partial [Deltaproteobacteria bacterium]|nr:2-hydroxyacyl-CoA dehydratase family protein [Deltaproteobacteria bacterium]
MGGACSDLEGMVFANSCDAMRKLFDIWGDLKDSPPAFFMDIPKKNDPDSIRYFTSVLKKLAAGLEETYSRPTVTPERLNAAIRETNRLRSSLGDIFGMQSSPDSAIKGSDVFPLLLAQGEAEIADHEAGIRQRASGQKGNLLGNGGSRIIITGTITANRELVDMIEEKGAHVAAFDICFGPRHYGTPVRENTPDPFAAVAERYLLRPPCPRMMGMKDQIDHLKSLVVESRAQGVIVSAMKYCDQLLYSLPLLREGVRELGVPVLMLENDYEWSDIEKARIKIEAFLETIDPKGGSHA